MTDPTEPYRRMRQAELNSAMDVRDNLEKKYGQVWDTTELRKDFEVVGFAAPFVLAKHKDTGVKGSLEFQHDPRFYFNWMPSDGDRAG